MIRGSIEVATPEMIQGWIHLDDGTVKDRTVLAYCDEECVGSGPVNLFREDLAQAGLGDGYLGFAIPLSIAEDAVGSIVVKLDGSDAVLLQGGARIGNAGAVARKLRRQTITARLASLKWALRHGRISQADFDFHRVLWSLGVYERGLIYRVPGEDKALIEDPHVTLTNLFESYAAQTVEIAVNKIRDPKDFSALLSSAAWDQRLVPLIGVYAKEGVTVRVIEGSHVSGALLPLSADGQPEATDYALAAENVLLMDARVGAQLKFTSGGELEVRVLSAATVL
jgi:hypothetical protein